VSRAVITRDTVVFIQLMSSNDNGSTSESRRDSGKGSHLLSEMSSSCAAAVSSKQYRCIKEVDKGLFGSSKLTAFFRGRAK